MRLLYACVHNSGRSQMAYTTSSPERAGWTLS